MSNSIRGFSQNSNRNLTAKDPTQVIINSLIIEESERKQRDDELEEMILDLEIGTDQTSNLLGTRVTRLEDEVIALESSLDDEVLNRTNADTALTNSINSEITARRDADTSLQTELANEIIARINADTAVTNSINSEITARINADTAVTNSINSEITARVNADTSLQTELANEIIARSNADTVLTNSVNTEVTHRTNADTSLQTQITSNTSALSLLNSIIVPEIGVDNVTPTGRYLFDVDIVNAEVYDLGAFNDELGSHLTRLNNHQDRIIDLEDDISEMTGGGSGGSNSTKTVYATSAGIGLAGGLLGASLFSVANRFNVGQIAANVAFECAGNAMSMASNIGNTTRGVYTRVPLDEASDVSDTLSEIEMVSETTSLLMRDGTASGGMSFKVFSGF